MGWNFDEMWSSVGEQVQGLFDAFDDETREGGLASLMSPIDPFNRSAVLTPIVAAAGVVGVVMLSGVAVGAMITTLSALMAIYYLLTAVFGYEISFAVPAQQQS
ncbi:MAG: hypothetical protein V3R77_08635 [Candidatus Binatia bacterium]